jgi:hypothetical protein
MIRHMAMMMERYKKADCLDTFMASTSFERFKHTACQKPK